MAIELTFLLLVAFLLYELGFLVVHMNAFLVEAGTWVLDVVKS